MSEASPVEDELVELDELLELEELLELLEVEPLPPLWPLPLVRVNSPTGLEPSEVMVICSVEWERRINR